jgi:Domain of unknown function DUF29
MAEAKPPATDGLHERDFYGWTQQQAELLRRAAVGCQLEGSPGLDWDNLAQEIWELGLSLELQLYHRYVVLLRHLLKRRYRFQPDRGSWRGSINEQRYRIERLLRKNPALKPVRRAEFEEAYEEARQGAADETELPISTFPEACPFTLEQAEDRNFWPASGPDA